MKNEGEIKCHFCHRWVAPVSIDLKWAYICTCMIKKTPEAAMKIYQQKKDYIANIQAAKFSGIEWFRVLRDKKPTESLEKYHARLADAAKAHEAALGKSTGGQRTVKDASRVG